MATYITLTLIGSDVQVSYTYENNSIGSGNTNIQRSNDEGQTWNVIDTTSSSPYLDTSAPTASRLYYRVKKAEWSEYSAAFLIETP